MESKVKEYIKCQESSQESLKSKKDQAKRIKELEGEIIEFLKSKPNKELTIGEYRIFVNEQKATKPLKLDKIKLLINKYFKEHKPAKASELGDFIWNNRESEVKYKLKMNKPKRKLPDPEVGAEEPDDKGAEGDNADEGVDEGADEGADE